MSAEGAGRPSEGEVHRSQDKKKFFDGLASDWAELDFSPEELAKVERFKSRLGDLRGLTVFEPGCGTGRLTRHLARWVGDRGRVIAADNSPRMAEAAKRTIDDAASWVSVHLSNAEEMSIPDHSVDLVLLFCVFPHFEDKLLALRRFSRMLTPDGRMVVAHLEGSEKLNAFHEGAGEPVCKDRIPPHAVLKEWIRSAGLRLCALIDLDEEFYLEAAPSGSPGDRSSAGGKHG